LFFVLFLSFSYCAVYVFDECCKHLKQESRAIALLLNYGIRLGVTVVGVANALL